MGLTIPVFSQQGIIRGTVLDNSTGEPILFGNVEVVKTSIGTVTDLDGKYSLSLDPGSYSLEFSYLGFANLIISDIQIEAGKTIVLDARLHESTQMIDEVVITSTQARNSEAALATLRRLSTNVMDGISSASFRKIGDSDAAAAIKRVTGVSVNDGKYVYVRGLGDRYSKTILNSVDVPGLDPDKNTLQMDIFPTNILDNILVLKTFTADLPGDFTGGLINITTKDFPDKATTVFSAGLGYNPGMHFNSNWLTYHGGATDFLGFDDGTRSIPTDRRENIPFRVNAISDPAGAGVEFRSILEDFNPNLAALRQQSFMDYSFGFSTGNQKSIGKYTLGYNVALTYQNNTNYYENAEYNRFGLSGFSDIYDMDPREQQIGDFGTNSALLGGLAGLSVKSRKSKFSLNVLHLQNGESKAGIFDYENSDLGANFEAFQHNLEYTQRELSNVIFDGNHNVFDGNWDVNYVFSGTRSSINDPDIRFTRIREDFGSLTIGSESGFPERIWRYLDEVNYSGQLNLGRNYKFNNKPGRLKFGSIYTMKERNYEIQNFQILTNSVKITDNPDDLFIPENLWSRENFNGLTYDPQFIPVNPNKFDATISNIGAYISNEFIPFNKLKTIVGLRVEKYTQKYSGTNQDGDVFDDFVVLDDLDLFPTANFIYSVTEKQNIRFSFSKTIARPSFKEASFATIIDPITGRTFIGGFFPDIDVATGDEVWNGQLVKTDILNFDLRWELFQERGQSISLSTFYKRFKNPIEIVQYIQASNNFQPRNVGDGTVFGFELEFLQNLGKITHGLTPFTFNANFTLVDSDIEMTATEFLSRNRFVKDGQVIPTNRKMAGQAPYLINLGMAYSNNSNTFESGFYYNVQGSTLIFVGIADKPDVYSVPFHSLNFNANYRFGSEEQFNVGFKAENLLGQVREEVFRGFNATDQIFTSLAPQRQVSFRIGYRFN